MDDLRSVRKDRTAMLGRALMRHLNPKNDPRVYIAREVTFDYGTADWVRVDFLRFKPVNNTVSGIEKGDFYCYEVKSSVEDFHSRNGHNLLGDFNYYVMPESVYEKVKGELPYHAGVLVPEGETLAARRKARRMDRRKPLGEMLFMMFRSAARDVQKKGGGGEDELS